MTFVTPVVEHWLEREIDQWAQLLLLIIIHINNKLNSQVLGALTDEKQYVNFQQ